MDGQPEGFVVGNPRIYAVHSFMTSGHQICVWVNGDGETGLTTHADPNRRIVTARPGETIINHRTPYVVERVESSRERLVVCQRPERR